MNIMKLFKILLVGIFLLSHQNIFSQDNIEKEKLKEESKKWLDGNFVKIFPEEKIYVYDVSYLFRGEIVEGEGLSEHKVNTLALSNINPSSITKGDFPVNKELNFVSYKYIKDYN